MKKKINDPDMPIGKLTRIPDFLPKPEDLAFPSDLVRVTIYLHKDSVEFFKKQAKRHRTKYQRMIRELLDKYADQHTRPKSS